MGTHVNHRGVDVYMPPEEDDVERAWIIVKNANVKDIGAYSKILAIKKRYDVVYDAATEAVLAALQ